VSNCNDGFLLALRSEPPELPFEVAVLLTGRAQAHSVIMPRNHRLPLLVLLPLLFPVLRRLPRHCSTGHNAPIGVPAHPPDQFVSRGVTTSPQANPIPRLSQCRATSTRRSFSSSGVACLPVMNVVSVVRRVIFGEQYGSGSPAHCRYNYLDEAALLWQDDCLNGDWYFACVQAFCHLAEPTEQEHHVTTLLPGQQLCNRPDKEQWLLISPAIAASSKSALRKDAVRRAPR
jgi:hypothetical protein